MTDTSDNVPSIDAGTLRKIVKRLRDKAARRDSSSLEEVADAIEYVLDQDSPLAVNDEVAKVLASTEEDRERYRL